MLQEVVVVDDADGGCVSPMIFISVADRTESRTLRALLRLAFLLLFKAIASLFKKKHIKIIIVVTYDDGDDL